MNIKLSRYAQQKLKAKKYKFVHTSFVTRDEGPAVGTIWFNKTDPREPPRIVKSVQRVKNRAKTLFVFFEVGVVPVPLERFLDMCDIGAYILIGVTPHVMSHTEI